MAITPAQRALALKVAVGAPGLASEALGVSPEAIMNALLGVLGTQFDAQCTTICAYMANREASQVTAYTVT